MEIKLLTLGNFSDSLPMTLVRDLLVSGIRNLRVHSKVVKFRVGFFNFPAVAVFYSRHS